jgi:hypothetical protein
VSGLRFERSRRFARLPVLIALVALACFVTAAVASADDNPQPIDFTHNALDAPAPVAGVVWGQGPKVKTGTAICSTAPSTAANVNTDCEENGPHNETSIAVNPTDTDNMIGGVNDYQLSLNPGGHLTETILSRAHVTFDGGQTWSEYPVFSDSSYTATGDPSLHSTRPATRTTERSASASSARRTSRTRTSSSRVRGTAASRGPSTGSPRGPASSRASAPLSTRSTSPRGATATRS